ncbi:MAG: two-component system, OmpR family, sensor kinase [Pseudonocardiales bacterium]|nr:two-component system, OmpR family, sensor kinase [Pseudonocardiales bacterium]
MSAIDTPPANRLLSVAWVAFAAPNLALMYLLPGEETIPYHLVWVSFAFVYGVARWPQAVTWWTFAVITVVTGGALVWHASNGIIGWEECSEVVLMGVIAALLVWHVNRLRAAEDRIAALREAELVRSESSELATRLGSHELRTRLTIARGFAELIRDVDQHGEQTRSDASIIVGELDTAATLATDILNLVRAGAPPAQEEVQVHELIDTVARRWTLRSDRSWSHRAPAGTIVGDPQRLEAALDCLIENAVRFTRTGDAISIEARFDGGQVVMSVADTGSGIPPEDLDRVFDLFHTSSTAGSAAGSGLGLAIVRTMVEGCGGSWRASSTLGSGTRVEIRVPVRPASDQGRRPDQHPVQPLPRATSGRYAEAD